MVNVVEPSGTLGHRAWLREWVESQLLVMSQLSPLVLPPLSELEMVSSGARGGGS